MKIKILVLLFGLTINSTYAQSELLPEFGSAVKLLKSSDFQKAVESFTIILEKASDIKMKQLSHIYRAFSYNGLKEYSKAIADFDIAIALIPQDLATYIDRGKTKGYVNDIEGAKKDFLFILEKDSTSKQTKAALYYLSKIAYKQNHFEESIAYCDKFIRLMPTDPEVYFIRGTANDMLLNAEGSIKDYDKAIQLDSAYTEAYANRGVAKINLLGRKGSIQLSKEQTLSACMDLKKAKQMGDNTVDDMIFIHCGKD